MKQAKNFGCANDDLFSENLPYCVSKSHAAFLMTCENLFRTFDKLYFWTWTFKNVHCDWQYADLFQRIVREITNHCRGTDVDLQGVRVVERHPSELSHGLHYHLILNARIPIGMIRRLGEKYGLGRISVRRAKPSEAFYLGKYLTKQRDNFYGGGGMKLQMQRWRVVGNFPGAIRQNDIVVNSITANAQRYFVRETGGRQLPFSIANLVYQWANLYGYPWQWDFRAKCGFWTKCSRLVKSSDESLGAKLYAIVWENKWGELKSPVWHLTKGQCL